MKINWKVRLKNKLFWLQVIPAIFLLVQTVAAPFGYKWDFVVLNEQLAAVINAVFGLLALLGVVNDPTTATSNDSHLAMTYTEPKQYWVDETTLGGGN